MANCALPFHPHKSGNPAHKDGVSNKFQFAVKQNSSKYGSNEKARQSFSEQFVKFLRSRVAELKVAVSMVMFVPSSKVLPEDEQRGSWLYTTAKTFAEGLTDCKPSLALRRTKAISKLAQGGSREIDVHLNSIQVTGDVKDEHVVVIDDIETSGNSLLACRKLLAQAGAASVTCFAFMKTCNNCSSVNEGLACIKKYRTATPLTVTISAGAGSAAVDPDSKDSKSYTSAAASAGSPAPASASATTPALASASAPLSPSKPASAKVEQAPSSPVKPPKPDAPSGSPTKPPKPAVQGSPMKSPKPDAPSGSPVKPPKSEASQSPVKALQATTPSSPAKRPEIAAKK